MASQEGSGMTCAACLTKIEEDLISLTYNLRSVGWVATVYWNEGQQLPTLMVKSRKNLKSNQKWLVRSGVR